MMTAIKNWWDRHVLVHFSALITLLATSDLATWLTGVHDDVVTFTGPKTYAALHVGLPLVTGAAMTIKARQLRAAAASAPIQPVNLPPGTYLGNAPKSPDPPKDV